MGSIYISTLMIALFCESSQSRSVGWHGYFMCIENIPCAVYFPVKAISNIRISFCLVAADQQDGSFCSVPPISRSCRWVLWLKRKFCSIIVILTANAGLGCLRHAKPFQREYSKLSIMEATPEEFVTKLLESGIKLSFCVLNTFTSLNKRSIFVFNRIQIRRLRMQLALEIFAWSTTKTSQRVAFSLMALLSIWMVSQARRQGGNREQCPPKFCCAQTNVF